jgi:hypothetical protein
VPGKELHSPPRQKLLGTVTSRGPSRKSYKRLAGSTRGDGYRMVRYFNRKRNPTQSPGKRRIGCAVKRRWSTAGVYPPGNWFAPPGSNQSEPIFEADLQPEQYAYRADRSALDAVRHVHKLLNTGHGQIVDADLSGYFDSIPHSDLLKSVARRIVDGAMLHLVKMWLEAPVEETDEKGNKHRSTRNRDEGRGTPQGAPISPLLSNLYMRRFVLGWKKLGHEKRLAAYIVSYADDLVICCRGQAEEALARMRDIMTKLK